MARTTESALRTDSRLRLRVADCLPVRFPGVACARCADACPTRALAPGAGSPRLVGDCVECGRCTVACPTAAIEVLGFALPTPGTSGPVLDCWRVPPRESPAGALRVPCLGGLTHADLLELTPAPEDHRPPPVLLDRGLCVHCPAGGAPTAMPPRVGFVADELLTAVRTLLKELAVPPACWPRRAWLPLPADRLRQPGGPLLEGRLSRRGLLTAAFASGTSPPATAPEAAFGPTWERPTRERPDRERLIAVLARLAPGRPLPGRLLPRLMASGDCADHRVCASACPAGALSGYADGEIRGLRFTPERCTGCGVCVALCPEQALLLHTPDADAAPASVLTRHRQGRCGDCGAAFSGGGDRCPACAADRAFVREAFATLFGATG